MTRYLQIAAEIRGRITDGRLRPGDPVPSTRRITQEWGVAMGTATKVIATLRDEGGGLVDVRPGAGTVVRQASRSQPGKPRAHELTRARILDVAITIADAEGAAPLSMRRVAAELAVATMSLYHHVTDKDELLLLMTDAVFAKRRCHRPDRRAGATLELARVRCGQCSDSIRGRPRHCR